MRRPGGLDFGIYLRGVAVLARAPLVVVPLVAAKFVVALLFGTALLAGSGLGLGGGIVASLLVTIIVGFGFGTALVGADLAWRERPASLRDMFEKARQRLGDIIWAAIAYSFVLYAAQLLGSFLLTPLMSVVGEYVEWIDEALAVAALFFVIYTMPAAVNGGVPGQAAVNESFVQARARPLPTLVMTIVYVVMYTTLPYLAAPRLTDALLTPFRGIAGYDILFAFSEALIDAVFLAYAAVVLAKIYDDLSTRRFFFR